MIAFKDFLPEIAKEGEPMLGIFRGPAEWESFQRAVDKANAWIATEGLDPINVETVVLPNLHSEDGPEDASLGTAGEFGSSWHQFVRVWYPKG